MSKSKVLFIDRDGTLIDEPADEQVDSLEKLRLKPNVVPALLELQNAGYQLVMVTNQDGLGTASFPEEDFLSVQNKFLDLCETQGIQFNDILICPHVRDAGCECRKPKLGLVLDYLRDGQLDLQRSAVIGDRQTDLELADAMGIRGILYKNDMNWLDLAAVIIKAPREASVARNTNETEIKVSINLDKQGDIQVSTGLGFFDHMLEQLAKHAGFNMQLNVNGDLDIDEHHTVEDTALALGQALRDALGDKIGIARYGFLLAMDESLAQVAIDLSGRPFCVFEGEFTREKVGELPTELVPHFFQSLSESLMAAINIKVTGENNHHMIESIFKGVGRALRSACRREDNELPTTKGVL